METNSETVQPTASQKAVRAIGEAIIVFLIYVGGIFTALISWVILPTMLKIWIEAGPVAPTWEDFHFVKWMFILILIIKYTVRWKYGHILDDKVVDFGSDLIDPREHIFESVTKSVSESLVKWVYSNPHFMITLPLYILLWGKVIQLALYIYKFC